MAMTTSPSACSTRPPKVTSIAAAPGVLPTSRLASAYDVRSQAPDAGMPSEAWPILPSSWIVAKGPDSRMVRLLIQGPRR
jgi:hypothetical protein